MLYFNETTQYCRREGKLAWGDHANGRVNLPELKKNSNFMGFEHHDNSVWHVLTTYFWRPRTPYPFMQPWINFFSHFFQISNRGSLFGVGNKINILQGSKSTTDAYFRIEKDPAVLENIGSIIEIFKQKKNIQRGSRRRRRRDLSEKEEEIKEAIIVTFESEDILCQMIIAATESDTYLSLKYEKASVLVTASYSDFDPSCPDYNLLTNVNATHSSNIDIPGVFVFSLTSETCKKQTERTGKSFFLDIYYLFYLHVASYMRMVNINKKFKDLDGYRQL